VDPVSETTVLLESRPQASCQSSSVDQGPIGRVSNLYSSVKRSCVVIDKL